MELVLEKLSLAEWETNKGRFEHLKKENERLIAESGRQLMEIASLKHEVKMLKGELADIVVTPNLDTFMRGSIYWHEIYDKAASPNFNQKP